MPYVNIASRSNTESGTLTDGTSTATFTEIEQYILGSGDDKVFGSTEGDTVETGEGADTVDGGAGNDAFDLGGNDGDRDEVVLENGDGHDTITGVEGPVDLGGGEYSAQDQLNVSNLFDNDDNPVNTADVTITVDGNGNPTLTFPDGTAVTLEGLTAPSTDSTDPVMANWLFALGIPYAPNYIVEGTSGGDLINGSYTGDPEGDMVDANDNQDGDNDDSIDAGEGDDTIYAGEGDDTVRSDEGDDEVYGGAGNDSIFGFEGSDTVDGGEGDDYINTRTSTGTGVPDSGLNYPDDPNTAIDENTAYSYTADTNAENDRDSVIGGAGNDTILTGDDRDTIDGGSGADVIDAGFDADTVKGGSGNDSIQGGEGADTIDGGDDDDIIYGGLSPLDPNYAASAVYDLTDDIDPDATNNADSLVGGAGNDKLYGQDDADTLEGGTGNDTLDGGIDDDLLVGGAGDDELTGGEGDDAFVLDTAGNDTITDFGSGISGGIKDDDQTNNDFIDLSGSYENLKDLRADFEDDGILNHSNSTAKGGDVDYTGLAAITGGLTLTGAAASGLTWDTTNVMCFTAGTLIRTIDGLVPAEDITQGMLVWTKDDGYQPIRWIGTRRMTRSELAEHANVRPIRIKAGALGDNLPERDLLVSPQHRILVNSKIVHRLQGEDEVLVSAKHLLQVEGIDVENDLSEVTYVHFLFHRHQIVESEGAETESLFTGPEALKAVENEARKEILAIFPELAELDHARLPIPIRPILSGRQGRKLANRHASKNKYLTQ